MGDMVLQTWLHARLHVKPGWTLISWLYKWLMNQYKEQFAIRRNTNVKCDFIVRHFWLTQYLEPLIVFFTFMYTYLFQFLWNYIDFFYVENLEVIINIKKSHCGTDLQITILCNLQELIAKASRNTKFYLSVQTEPPSL